MPSLDYSVLFDYTPRLALVYDAQHPTMRWRLDDQIQGRTFARATTRLQAVAFIRALERRGDATVDENSIALHELIASEASWPQTLGGEPQAGRFDTLPDGGAPSRRPIVDEPASPPEQFSVRVPSNVVPLRP